MLTTELIISIPGHAAPKGSLKCVGRPGGPHILVEDNKRTKEWRLTIALWVRKSWHLQKAAPKQPIGAEITYTLPRPKAHYGTGRNAYALKPNAPTHPTSHATGDIDKLLRLTLDALQDTDTLPDDCQIVELTTRKAYPINQTTLSDVLSYPGIVIRLYPVEDDALP